MSAILFTLMHYHLWPSGAIWLHRDDLILVWVMAWCHQAPSHYLNQCWLMVLWHQLESSFPGNLSDEYQNYILNLLPHLPGANELTLNVWRLSYPGLTRSVSWSLMPWLLALPGHQQPWYWLCRQGISRSLSYMRKNFNYLCCVSVEEW